MNLPNEHRFIRGTAIGLLLLALLLFYFNITVNNNKLNMFSDPTSLNFYKTFGFVMLGNLIPYFVFKQNRMQHLLVLGVGVAFAIGIWFFHPASWELTFWSEPYLFLSFIGFGLASMVVVLLNKPNSPEENHHRQKMIDFYIFLNLLQFSIYSVLDLTTLLHPFSFDSVGYRIDATFGFLPSVAVAQLYSQYQWFATLLNMAYDWAPMAFTIIFSLQLRHKKAPPANMLMVWAVATVACLVAYHFCPISGPGYLFGSSVFPNAMPETAQISYFSTLASASFRNGFPSMHFGACLMFIFTARYQKSLLLNIILYITAALVFLATLGKGEHYLIDLIVSFPFIVAIQSYCTRVSAAGRSVRTQAIFGGIAIWLLWVVLVRNGFPLFYYIPGFSWLLSIATIAVSLYLYRRLWPYEVWGEEIPAQPQEKQLREISWSSSNLTIPALFFISGFTGLMYEVIFSKELALTFGGMATATYTVLAVYMGGMAIGAWLGGMLMHRTKKDGLVLYALCELFIGVYCILTPILFFLIKELYVILAQGTSPDVPELTALRVICGALVLLVPTIFMGMTLPVMVTELQRRGLGVGSAVARLYGANTLGAAMGALISGYFILPFLGVFKSVALSAVGSLLVALMALKLSKLPTIQSTVPEAQMNNAKAMPTTIRPEMMWAGLFALFLTGCVTLLMEVNYMQLLAVVAGNSVYAFALMLFSLLIGLGVGAVIAQLILKRGVAAELALSVLLLLLASVLLYGVFQWNNLPKLFAVYELYPYHLSFAARETIRAFVCWMMMFPPAVIIGICYPLALELVTANSGQFKSKRLLGSAIGLNTLGNIVGAVAGGFILLPLFGTQKSVWIAASICIVAGVVLALTNRRYKHPLVYVGLLIALTLFAIQPHSFNFTQLASGSNVYFQGRDIGEVIDYSESLDGGLTTVSIKNIDGYGELKTLLTNGKFQGNNALNGEMKAQVGFAVAPLLHTTQRDKALVIGYGTGVSSRTLKESGFKQLDIVDLSRDLVSLANKHFANVNKTVSEQPGVHFYATDGRNFLMLQDRRYDLISMEISSIWFAGAASLYNEEFYTLAKTRLTENGILQQWVQLHHITPTDLASILSSIRAVFPYVSLYELGGQGIIVASNQPQQSSDFAMQLMKDQAGLMHMLQQVGMEPEDVAAQLVLSPNDVNRMMKMFASSSDFHISTDDNLFLEYSTPKGNALDALKSTQAIQQFLAQFSTARASEVEKRQSLNQVSR